MSEATDAGDEAAAKLATARLRASAQRHTSIVYFHGMGTPKRYEELSRVLDSLDRYAVAADDLAGLGSLRGQIVDLEPSSAAGDEPVAFIRFQRLVRAAGRTTRTNEFRLYESFWSPAAAGGVSPLQVLLWVLVRALNPLAVLLRPWRAHQRLKLAFLSRMAFDKRNMPMARFRQLYTLYRSFEGMELRRRRPGGFFEDFLCEIAEQTKDDANARSDLFRLALEWKGKLVDAQMWVLLVGLTTVCVLASLFTLALGDIGWLFAQLGVTSGPLSPLALRSSALPGWIPLSTLFLLPFAYLQARAFLKYFLSDVVFWTTTFEKDLHYQKRREILKGSEATLRHVLSDPRCERVVIVAHSLGTAIAYETLLNLGRRLKAQRNTREEGEPDGDPSCLLRKLSHFVTYGSPIDRIAYFFNLTYSRYHRFNRVADDLMGRTSDAPFRMQKVRSLQWWNIRDAADPIASRLFTPRGRLPNREDIVEVEAASSHVPNPASAHVGYFDSALGAKVSVAPTPPSRD